MSTVSSPPTFKHVRGSWWEAKRSKRLTTGDVVQSIDPLNRAGTYGISSVTLFFLKKSHITQLRWTLLGFSCRTNCCIFHCYNFWFLNCRCQHLDTRSQRRNCLLSSKCLPCLCLSKILQRIWTLMEKHAAWTMRGTRRHQLNRSSKVVLVLLQQWSSLQCLEAWLFGFSSYTTWFKTVFV